MSKLSQTVFEDPRGEFRTANQLGGDAAEAIRGVNHLTRDDGSLRYPSQVYGLLADLSQLGHREVQAFQQIDAIVSGWVEDGRVSIDEGEFVGHPEAAAAALVGLPGRRSASRGRTGAGARQSAVGTLGCGLVWARPGRSDGRRGPISVIPLTGQLLSGSGAMGVA